MSKIAPISITELIIKVRTARQEAKPSRGLDKMIAKEFGWTVGRKGQTDQWTDPSGLTCDVSHGWPLLFTRNIHHAVDLLPEDGNMIRRSTHLVRALAGSIVIEQGAIALAICEAALHIRYDEQRRKANLEALDD